MNTRMFTQDQEIEICEYYWTRLPTGFYPSYKEVGDHFECSAPLVKLILKRNGYKRRTQAETREKRPCKPPKERGDPPPCACGCGNLVTWDTGNKRWFKYFLGHYSGTERKIVQPEFDRSKPRFRRGTSQAIAPQTLSKDDLIEMYCVQNHTIREIAGLMNVGYRTVKNALISHGIELRSVSESLTVRGSTRGANNPAWKGGVADWDYSHDWKSLSKKIKDRDQWTCQLCGEQRKRWGNNLHVHHIDEDKTNNHPHNLIALCSTCHHPIHGKDGIKGKLSKIAVANTAESIGAIQHP